MKIRYAAIAACVMRVIILPKRYLSLRTKIMRTTRIGTKVKSTFFFISGAILGTRMVANGGNIRTIIIAYSMKMMPPIIDTISNVAIKLKRIILAVWLLSVQQ